MASERTTGRQPDPGSGFGLILLGLLLALLGAGSVMLMVVGASDLYVGKYSAGIALLSGFIVGAGIFLKTYGPYLDRLEQRAPMEPDSERAPLSPPPTPPGPSPSSPSAGKSDPLPSLLPTNLVIALATGAYGLFIIGGGLIWTRGQALTLNLLAGGALMLCGVLAWWFGRPAERADR